MEKFTGFSVSATGSFARAIAESGKQYALYLFHGDRKWSEWPQGATSDRFNVNLGWFRDTVNIDLPRGEYRVEWINPSSGSLIDSSNQSWTGGNLILLTPRYYTDIALKINSLTDSK